MKGFSSYDVTEDMKRDVVRVVAHHSTPMMVTASGVASASHVDHVVMQDSAKKSVIQPVTEDALDRIVASAISSQFTMHGQTAEFATEDFRKIRGEGGNAEFFVTVIGPKEQKDFKVKTKDFEKL